MTKGLCNCLFLDSVGCGRPKEREQVSTVAPRLFNMKYHNPGGKEALWIFCL